MNTSFPKTALKQILGSIYAFDQTSQAKSKTQFGLSNEFAMALGVSLNQNPDEKLIPDLKLNKVAPDAVNRIPYIIANVANVAPTMFRGMTVNADVTRQGNAKRVYHKTINDAPWRQIQILIYKFQQVRMPLNRGNII
ncbi:cell surface protein precursor [Agrilactobacillus composti DSM 18527 = JCM 14202]|uniref:WxL protein host-binding domain-containing protein n=1 Tax=Agrilactobacillus composti TaxID=398555 RepID=UPI00042E0154|nr:DUF3324 domain-containing protein [Agrilactobacillus composti]GAF38830.1 cell surface protein precursor [Agrilactobacillus composti DSM 18527 = JCM 14202]